MIALAIEILTPDETEKFEQLVTTWSKMMYREANRILKHHHDAEDALQRACLRLFQNMKKIDDPTSDSAGNYAYIAARHAAIDLLRERSPEMPIDYFEEELAFEDRLAFEDDLNGLSPLARCIAALSDRERSILHLRIEMEMSQREAASLLGITVAAAAKMEQRAKKHLRELCEKEEIL